MKMKLGLAAFCAAMCVMGTASAADLGTRMPVKAPVMAPVYNSWAGLYVGGHIGGGFGARDDDSVDGFIGGGQLGYNWQFGAWVLGIEGQISGSAVKGDSTRGALATTTDLNWLASVTGKVGYAIAPTALLYAKGGVAFADYDYKWAGLSNSDTRTGWTVGAGAEWSFAPQWSVFAEYQYYDFGSDTYNFAGTAVDFDSAVHTVKAGVNYRFGN
jgi:outer membrane immunogenic protein